MLQNLIFMEQDYVVLLYEGEDKVVFIESTDLAVESTKAARRQTHSLGFLWAEIKPSN